MKCFQLLVITIFLITSNEVRAQEVNKAKLDSLFDQIEQNDQGMGSISIFRAGEEIYNRSTGFSDISNRVKSNTETKYRIGSISKMFTAVIVMQLIEEGKLSLDSKLSEFHPSIENAKNISVEMLLRHQSGIFNITNDPEFFKWMEREQSSEELINKMKSKGSQFKPGSTSAYSNSNYILLTLIAEEIEGKTFTNLVAQRILQPLNLKHTKVGSSINVSNNEAHSYSKLSSWMKSTETHMSVPRGAGNIISTPTDLNTFLSSLYSGKLVNDSLLTDMMQIEKGFGIGMFKVPYKEKSGYGHTGGIDGFQSNAFYFPNEKVSISYISNGTVFPINDILIASLGIVFEDEVELPSFEPKLKLSTEDLIVYQGVYSSSDFPLKITITTSENVLVAQATGQPSFPLEAVDSHVFVFKPAGITFTFNAQENTMKFEQGGGKYIMSKE